MTRQENICPDLHKSNRSPIWWQGKKISDSNFISLIGQDRYFLILSSGWRSIRHVKVESDIFLPCHVVGVLLDLWRSRHIFKKISVNLHQYNRSPIWWQGKKISVSSFISLIGLQLDDKLWKYLPWPCWRSIRHVKVESDIFLPCHVVGVLLDLWRSRHIFYYLVIWLEAY
jgi:predicted ferric reductase